LSATDLQDTNNFFIHNAKKNKQNTIVIAYETLPTVGATDNYDYSHNPPVYHQRYAEIMAGRIPLSQSQAEIPKDLRFCLIADQTAKEINWIPAQSHNLSQAIS